MSVIDEVKQKTDIVAVVSQYVALKKAGRNQTGLCPFHSERNPSFFVYPEQQSWHCFGCNTGGDVFSFLMKKENIDFGEALRLLADKSGVTIPSHPGRQEDREEKDRLHQVNEAAARYFHELLLNHPQAEKARNYVKNRGFTAQTLSDFQLGFSLNQWHALKDHLLERGYQEKELLTAGLIVASENGRTHDRFRDKLMFPIWDARGRVAGFGARVLDDSLPKYVNSPQTPVFEKNSIPYALHLASASIRQQDQAVIVEGYMDAITAHQNGFTNVVASMGTSVTETQVRALKRLSRNLVLALDADSAGEEAMLRGVVYENILETEVRVAVLPPGKDPDDVIKEDVTAWQRLVAEAVPIVDYTFNMTTSRLNMKNSREQASAIERLLPIIAELKKATRIDHYINKLSKLTGLSYQSIESSLKAYITNVNTRKINVPKQEALVRATRPLASSRLEEDYLAFLLQHPDLRGTHEPAFPDYFTHSENREIFIAWQDSDGAESLREKLDPAMQEHFEMIAGRPILTTQAELRDAEYRRRLQERYYRNLAAREEEALRLEVEVKGIGADLVRLEAAGAVEIAERLKELYNQSRKKRLESRR